MKGLFIWLLAASLAAFALPNDAAAADCTDRTSLPATPDGEAVAAVGFAYIRSIDQGSQQTFVV
ncbi:MAG: hypothetical protein DME08_16235, partial [Candidatus Rokuibacteriota bacterium]